MAASPDLVRRVQQARTTAQLACFAFGVALMLWGLSPLVVARVVTNDPVSLRLLATSVGPMLLGITFIGFCMLIMRGINWALWGAFWLALVLLAASTIAVLITRAAQTSVFAVVLAIATVTANWLAIAANKAAVETDGTAEPEPSEHTPTPEST